MNKQKVAYPYNRVSATKRMKNDTRTVYMSPVNTVLRERSRTQKPTYCTVPFIWNRR